MVTEVDMEGRPMTTATKMAVKIAAAQQITGERLLTVQETATIIGAAVGNAEPSKDTRGKLSWLGQAR